MTQAIRATDVTVEPGRIRILDGVNSTGTTSTSTEGALFFGVLAFRKR